MKAFRLAGALLSVLAATGCATHAKFLEKMDGFVGQPESVIVGTYGPPQGSYVMNDGSKVLQYTRGRTVMLPGATTYQPVTTNTMGNMTINQGMRSAYGTYNQTSTSYVPQQAPATPLQLWCTVNFTIGQDGIVQRWASSGNRCVAD